MPGNAYDIHFLTGDLGPAITDHLANRFGDHEFASVKEKTQRKIDVQYDDNESILVSFNLGEDWQWNEPRVLMTVSPYPLKADKLGESTNARTKVRDRVEKILTLVTDIVEITAPEYVYSAQDHGAGSYRGVRPLERPIVDNISKMNWLTVFSEPLISELGGRERVLNTPAWRVEELDSGHIMIVKTDNPAYPTVEPVVDPVEYLLEDANADPDDDVSENIGLADPFAALDTGEYGADICVYREDISQEFPNEVLNLVRVRVDENRDLRRVDNDQFVRNIVDDGPDDDIHFIQQMLADVPADASEEDLMVTALLHEHVPPAFVRLADPEDENVVTRLMDLEADVSKFDLLTTLSRVAHHGDFGDEGLSSIEGALETLNEIDDTDAVEEYIEAKFL